MIWPWKPLLDPTHPCTVFLFPTSPLPQIYLPVTGAAGVLAVLSLGTLELAVPSSHSVADMLYNMFITFLAGGTHLLLVIRASGLGPKAAII